MFLGTRWRRSLIQCAASCRTRILRPLIYLGPTPDLNVGKCLAEGDFCLSPKWFVTLGSSLHVWVAGELVFCVPDWKYGVPKILRSSVCVFVLSYASRQSVCTIFVKIKLWTAISTLLITKIRILETFSLPQRSSVICRLLEWTIHLYREDVLLCYVLSK